LRETDNEEDIRNKRKEKRKKEIYIYSYSYRGIKCVASKCKIQGYGIPLGVGLPTI
jgi:hypothetical protein